VVLLDEKDPLVASLALAHLPPLPEERRGRLFELMTHRNYRVAYAAVEAAVRQELGGTPDGAAALLAVLGASDHQWIVSTAIQGLTGHPEQRPALVRTLVDRLAEPALTYDCFMALGCLWDNAGGGSGGGISEAKAAACAAAWRTFLAAHEEEIAAGRRWTLPHAEVPRTLAPQGMHYSLASGEEWPPRR